MRKTSGFCLELSGSAGIEYVQAEQWVNAAGPFAKDVAAMIGIDLPVKNVLQQKIAFADRAGAIPRQMSFSVDLDARMLERLANTNPGANLQESNLNDFCTVLEGVSHFVYLAWNAEHNRQITQLELELQAEIDKYISARMLLESQANRGLAETILHELFESVVYRSDLSPDRLHRYQQANQFAARYCYNLQQRFPSARVSPSMVHELRDVYRMPQRDKLSYFQTVQYA